jgi:hypothetical protein
MVSFWLRAHRWGYTGVYSLSPVVSLERRRFLAASAAPQPPGCLTQTGIPRRARPVAGNAVYLALSRTQTDTQPWPGSWHEARGRETTQYRHGQAAELPTLGGSVTRPDLSHSPGGSCGAVHSWKARIRGSNSPALAVPVNYRTAIEGLPIWHWLPGKVKAPQISKGTATHND